MTDAPPYEPPPRVGPEGIGGWLILPTVGLILTPLTGLAGLGQYSDLSEAFPYLTGAQKTFVVLEIVGNLAIVVLLPVILLFRLFGRKVGFPRLYVTWAVANFAFTIADLIAARVLFGDVFEAQGVDLVDADTLKDIFRSIVLVVIWVPYMLTSLRVRNTFVY
jgi:hypothetical protein